MKSYDELKAEMEANTADGEAKRNKRANALKLNHLCKELVFTAGMLKGSLAEGRRKQ